jgi:hypothetical protein
MDFLANERRMLFVTIMIECATNFLIPFVLYSNSNEISLSDSLIVKQDTVVIPVLKDTLKDKKIVVFSVDTAATSVNVTSNVSGFDKIIKRNGDSILCKIIGKNLYEVEYQKPGNKTSSKLSTASIKELFYSDGKYELIDNNPEKKKKDWTVTAAEKDWNKVQITSEQADVEGMVEKGTIEATFEAKKMNTDADFLERNAYSILKKKAYALKAGMVLIVSKTINRTYGELPNIEIKAVAYGKE